MTFVEAAIRRMSPSQRWELQHRLCMRCSDVETQLTHMDASEYGGKAEAHRAAYAHYAMLGRFSALTAGLEVR